MKIIDLLNKIANGEEVPEKIKFKNTLYTLIEYDVSTRLYHSIEQPYEGLDINTTDLNDEVELIEEKDMCINCHKYPAEYNQTYCEFCSNISEEDNKIRKICTFPDLDDEDYAYEDGDRPNNVRIYNQIEKLLINKINEIIDKVNKEKE